MPTLNPSTAEHVSITFRLSKAAHKALMAEVGYCGCNISSFIRNAVMKEIADRRFIRKYAADHAVLRGQIDIEGNVNA